MKNNRMNLTEGPIVKKILWFALPLLASSLVQQLYNTVDLLVVGRRLGTNAAAAVGASSMIVTLIVGLFGGLAVGAGVVAAREFGARNRPALKRTLQTAVIMTLVCSVVLTALGVLLAGALLHLMQTPAEIFAEAVSYLRIYFLSLFFIISYNMGSGLIRAMGDSMTPLWYQLIGGAVNILADVLFVMVFHRGVNGVAVATLFSQGVASLLTIRYLFRTLPEDIRLHPGHLSYDRALASSILKVGLPAGFQAMVVTLSNAIAQGFVNSLGTVSIAAFATFQKVELPIWFPLVAVGQAAMTFMAQNLGAGNPDRARKGIRICLLLSLGVTAVMSGVLLLLARPAFGLFVKDTAVIEAGARMVFTAFPFYVVYCFLQIYGDAIKGGGESRIPMLIVLVNICIVRSVLLAILVPRYPDIRTVALVYPVTWTLTSAVMTLYYRFGRWKNPWAISPRGACESSQIVDNC